MWKPSGNVLLAGLLLVLLPLPAVSEAYELGGSRYNVYAPPGYSLKASESVLTIANAAGDHAIQIFWGRDADLRGMGAEDALTAIVGTMIPKEEKYILIEPFRTVSNGSLSFRVVDLRYDASNEVRADGAKAWVIYSLLVRAAITATPAGNRVVFVGVQRTNASTESFNSIETYRQAFNRVIDRFVPSGADSGSAPAATQKPAITPEAQKALDAEAARIHGEIFPPDRPARCRFSFDQIRLPSELALQLVVGPMQDAVFSLSGIWQDYLVFSGSWKNKDSTIESIQFVGTGTAAKMVAQGDKSRLRLVLPLPPATIPMGDILGQWRAASYRIQVERSGFANKVSTNTTFMGIGFLSGLGALAWGLIDCILVKGSADTFNVTLMGAGGGAAVLSTAVALIVEDGLKRGMDGYIGELEQVKRDLVRRYPDSFSMGR